MDTETIRGLDEMVIYIGSIPANGEYGIRIDIKTGHGDLVVSREYYAKKIIVYDPKAHHSMLAIRPEPETYPDTLNALPGVDPDA